MLWPRLPPALSGGARVEVIAPGERAETDLGCSPLRSVLACVRGSRTFVHLQLYEPLCTEHSARISTRFLGEESDASLKKTLKIPSNRILETLYWMDALPTPYGEARRDAPDSAYASLSSWENPRDLSLLL